MRLVCPECKNNVDLAAQPGLAPEQIVECDICGITLLVKNIDGETVSAEVVDEGK